MACVGMILVEIAMQVTQRAVIRTVLGSAVEALLVSALVSFVHFSMKPIVRRMIARVSVIVARIAMGEGRCGCGGQSQRSRCHQGFCYLHWGVAELATELIGVAT